MCHYRLTSYILLQHAMPFADRLYLRRLGPAIGGRRKKEEDGESGKWYIQISQHCLLYLKYEILKYELYFKICHTSNAVSHAYQNRPINLYLLVWLEVRLLKYLFKSVLYQHDLFSAIVCIGSLQIKLLSFILWTLWLWKTEEQKWIDRFNCARINLWNVRVSR